MSDSKKQTTEKVPQVGFTLSLKSANPAAYPLVYQSDAWDVAQEDTKLGHLLGGSGQFDQHTINEELAKAAGDQVFEPGDGAFSAKQKQSVEDANVAAGEAAFAGGAGSKALGRTAFAFGDHVTSIGDNAYATGKNTFAGIYGWYYKYVDLTTGTFYLTTEQPDVRKISDMGPEPEVDPDFNSGFEVGDVISYVNKNKRDLYATITEVNGNKVVVGQLNDVEYVLEEEHPNHDDWTIFVPAKPAIGKIWLGEASFAEGLDTKAVNAYTHTEGKGTLAYGQFGHAEGKRTRAGYASHAEGESTEAAGTRSHAEGMDTHSLGHFSHAEGGGTVAGDGAKKAGRGETTPGYFTHAEGTGTLAKGNAAHAEGRDAQAIGNHSHAEGINTQAIGESSHAEGNGTKAKKSCSHTEGSGTIADGWCAHAEGGEGSKATGSQSHAEGTGTTASGNYSHAEGATTTASGGRSHAEGMDTLASGEWSHAEGANTVAGNSAKKNSRGETATGQFTHAEGNGTLAKGNAAHAEGCETQAIGDRSHAEGNYTQTSNFAEHSEGQLNKSNKASDTFGDAGNTLSSIGIGTGGIRKNAFEVMQNGKVFIKDVGNYDGTNPTESGVKDVATVINTDTSMFSAGAGTDSAVQRQSSDTVIGLPVELNSAISSNSVVEGGGNVAGLKGYRYTNTGTVENTLTFEVTPDGWAVGDVVSIINKDKYSDVATIESIDGNVVTFTEPLNIGTEFIDESDFDSKCAYVSAKPTVGDVDLGAGAHAEGVRTRAINTVAHAEGRDTVASGQYSHAEGRGTSAKNYIAHAEGHDTMAKGMTSHAEGYKTTANGNNSHSEGRETETFGDNSHVEGARSHTGGTGKPTPVAVFTNTGYAAHAEGNGAWATGSSSHAEGYSTVASALAAHAEGNQTVASGMNSHASGLKSVAEGYASTAMGRSAHALHDRSFVWQGLDTDTQYHSHNIGTININPVPAEGSTDPATGFWIGEKTLAQRLNEASPSITQVNADWNATSGVAQILNKPTIPSIASDIGALEAAPLAGKTYNCSTNAGYYRAIEDIVRALGGTITNSPLSPIPSNRTTLYFDDGTSESYDWSGEINQQTMIDAGLFDVNEEDFWTKTITKADIGTDVTSIGDYVFQSCTGLTSVTIPNSVTNIGQSTFSDCTSLTSVTIGNGMLNIDPGAFINCISLASVTIPDSVTSIGDFVFSDCTGLVTVTIPASVESIGSGAFQHCSSLTDLIFEGKTLATVQGMEYYPWGADPECIHANA